MRVIIAQLFILAVSLPASTANAQAASSGGAEQISRLIAGVHSRVSDAALAATYVLEADRHRRQAEQMRAAGQHDKARMELKAAEDIVTAANERRIQGDLLLYDYVSQLRQAFTALDDVKEHRAGTGFSPNLEDHHDLSFVEAILRANSLPKQLAAVVMVESGGNPIALSSKGAGGLWQLMPDTARRYGLRVDDQVDERFDPMKSTYAAVRYLRDLYEMFHDWPLALAAYNAGENRIQSLIHKARVRRFTEMAARQLLPLETMEYVPAVLNLMRRTPFAVEHE